MSRTFGSENTMGQIMANGNWERPPQRVSLLARLPLYAYMFYVIYTPPIGIDSPMVKFALLASGPLVLSFFYALRGDSSVWRRIVSRPALPLMLSFLAGSVYIAVVMLVSSQTLESIDDLRVVQNSVIILVVLNVLFIIDLLAKTGHDWVKSFEVVLWLGAAQGVFAILGVLIPEVHDVSRSLYIAAGGTNEFVIRDRIFGISSDFTYGTQIYHAILAGCALYVMMREKRPYLIPIILVMATSLLNGRTGLIAFAAMAAIIVVVMNLGRFNLLGVVIGVVALGLGAALAFGLLEEYAPTTYTQLMAFFSDTEALFDRNEYLGNYSVLIPELMRVPEGNGLLFGEGVRLYTEAQGERTDIGLNNDLFAGGLVYVVLVYVAFVVFLGRSLKGHPALFLALIVAATIANLKGELFRSTTLLFVFVFVPLVILYGGPRKRPRSVLGDAQPSVDEAEAGAAEPVENRSDSLRGPAN